MSDRSAVPILGRLARAIHAFHKPLRLHYERASCTCPSCRRYGHHCTNTHERDVARAARALSRALADFDDAVGRGMVDREIVRVVRPARRKFDELIDRWGWRPVIGPDWKADHVRRRRRYYRDEMLPFLEANVSWREDLDLAPNPSAAAAELLALRRGIRPTMSPERAAGIVGPLWERLWVESRWGDSLPVCDSEDVAVFEVAARQLEQFLPAPAEAPKIDAPKPSGERQARADRQMESPGPLTVEGRPRKPKRSTNRGDGRAKVIAALTRHHRYAEGGCLNLDPIGNNKLARAAGVSPSTASTFFKGEFKGYAKYQVACRDAGSLAAALKLLNGEFSPHDLYGRQPADEDDRDE